MSVLEKLNLSVLEKLNKFSNFFTQCNAIEDMMIWRRYGHHVYGRALSQYARSAAMSRWHS